MAIVGCLGDIVFQVSSRTVETLDKLKWSGSARYSSHARHGTHALTEFCGLDPDAISFDVELSAYCGTDPMSELTKIWNYERSGAALPLTIGNKGYGKYRWNIVKHSMSAKHYDGRGNITDAVVSLTLQEYLRS